MIPFPFGVTLVTVLTARTRGIRVIEPLAGVSLFSPACALVPVLSCFFVY
jgi:hypothetical protein